MPNGEAPYSGTVTVKQKRAAFELDWDITAGLDYVLDPQDPGSLLATWALGGFASLGTEKLKRG
jgi:hypothetical protein